jgi:hypothetical protein
VAPDVTGTVLTMRRVLAVLTVAATALGLVAAAVAPSAFAGVPAQTTSARGAR